MNGAVEGDSDVAEAALVSCIMPARNAARFVGEALESILAQTYRPLEVIVVDDGSDDATCRVARSYGEQVVVLSQAAAGPAAARNRGLRLARGPFIAFQDADDVWRPDKLERQMAVLRAQPALAYCLAHVQCVWAPDLREEAQRFRDHRRAQPVPGYSSNVLVAHRWAFTQVGLFNPALRFTDVIDWFLRAAERGLTMEMVPDVLTYRRMHGGNMSRVEADAGRAEFLRLARSVLQRRREQDQGVTPLPNVLGSYNDHR